MKKDSGAIEYTISLLFILVVCLLILYQHRMSSISLIKGQMDDGISASNLAAALIDIEEFGATNQIIIKDTSHAYDTYCNALISNLSLDDSYYPANDEFIKSNVTIHEFAIYNVKDNDIEVYKYLNGIAQVPELYPDAVSIMQTPNQKIIENTTIYSKIGFTLIGLMKDEHYVYKEESVDITIR